MVTVSLENIHFDAQLNNMKQKSFLPLGTQTLPSNMATLPTVISPPPGGHQLSPHDTKQC